MWYYFTTTVNTKNCVWLGELLHYPLEWHVNMFAYIICAFSPHAEQVTCISDFDSTNISTGACVCLCLWWAFLLICQPAVVYEVPLMAETIRPVKGALAVFSYSPQLIQTSNWWYRLNVFSQEEGFCGCYLRNLNEWKACKEPI